jgi:hypothetical protein
MGWQKMIKFKQFINETIDNLFITDIDKRKEYVDQIWDILQHSYVKIGGIHGKGFNSKEEMISDLPLWKVYRKGDKVKAVLIYKDKNGRKAVASGNDGESDTKKFFAKMKQDEYKTGRAYGEVSDNALFFIIKNRKMDILKDIIPYKEAVKRVKENGDEIQQLTLKDQRMFIDEVIEFFNGKDAHLLNLSVEEQSKLIHALTAACYRRKIGNHFHTKIMVGNLNAPAIKDKRG